jgi:hypothetical protein
MHDEELEPEVLSYREFRKREALLAWERRRRAHESAAPGRSDRRGHQFVKPPRAAAAPGAFLPR